MKTKYILPAVLIGFLMSSVVHGQEVPTTKAQTKKMQQKGTVSERPFGEGLPKAMRSDDVSKSNAGKGGREPLASELPIEKVVPKKVVAPIMPPTQ